MLPAIGQRITFKNANNYSPTGLLPTLTKMNSRYQSNEVNRGQGLRQSLPTNLTSPRINTQSPTLSILKSNSSKDSLEQDILRKSKWNKNGNMVSIDLSGIAGFMEPQNQSRQLNKQLSVSIDHQVTRRFYETPSESDTTTSVSGVDYRRKLANQDDFVANRDEFYSSKL